MWDRFTDYCSDIGCKFRDWRRKMYWWHHGTHQHLMYPDIPPYHSANYGYFQTCWRPMPDCQRCPEINYTTLGSAPRTQRSQPPTPPANAPLTPGPAGDQPPPPPATQSSPYFPPAEDAKPEPIPPPQAPPEEFGFHESAKPLNQHFKLLPPEDDIIVVSSDDRHDQHASEPHPFFPILPVDVVLPNDGWEPYAEKVPGIIIRARGVYE